MGGRKFNFFYVALLAKDTQHAVPGNVVTYGTWYFPIIFGTASHQKKYAAAESLSPNPYLNVSGQLEVTHM